MLSKIKKLLPQKKITRNISILAIGSIFAQAITALSLPLLTRLYTPEDFSVLASYAAILSLILSISCLRFNIAIPIAQEKTDAINLLAIAVFSAATFTVIISLILIIAPNILILLKQEKLNTYSWLIPIGVFFGSIYTAMQYWASRNKEFPLITKTRITRALGSSSVQIGAGAINPTAFGLLFGHLLYNSMGTIALSANLWRNNKLILNDISVIKVKHCLKKYSHFPKYSVPEALFNTASIQLPILIIASTGSLKAGFVMLAMRLLGIPIILLGRAVSQVYLSEAPQKYREGTLRNFTIKITKKLFLVSFIPFLVIGISSPFIFPFVFGKEWSEAGIIVSWMTPWFMLQFISSPVSVVLHITNNILQAMFLQLFGMLFRVGVVLFSLFFYETLLIEFYSISGAIFYLFYYVVIYSIINNLKANENPLNK